EVVDSRMFEKSVILGGHKSVNQGLGNLFVRDQNPFFAIELAHFFAVTVEDLADQQRLVVVDADHARQVRIEFSQNGKASGAHHNAHHRQRQQNVTNR